MSRLARGSQCDIRSGFEFPRGTKPTEAGEAKKSKGQKAMSQGTHTTGSNLLQKGSGEPWPYRAVDREGREGRSPTSEQKQMHGACSFCRACAGTPPGTSPQIPLLENWQQVVLGCAADLRYQRGGRGMGGESGTEEAAKGDGESKRVRITTRARNTQGVRNSEGGACRANEHAAQPRALPLRLLAQEEAGDAGRPHALVPARKGCRSQYALGSAERRLQET